MNLSQLKEQVRNILRERSVKAIQKDYSNVVDDIQKHLELYKKSKGTPEEKKHIGHLKTLGEKKKSLQKELDLAVSGLYKNAELKVDEAITNPKKSNPNDLATTVIGWYDFATDYIDDGGQRRRAIKSNEDVVKWFDSHPLDVKQKAFKVMLSKQPSIKSKIERVFGSSLKESVNETNLREGKYYVTYNKGRGQGKDLEKEFDQKTFKTTNKPKVFNSYNDAKKYAEKMEKMFRNSIGGGTAYWVSDEKMNPIKESVITEDTRRVKLLGIDFKISEMNGRIFFSFVDKKAASVSLRQVGTNKIVNHIQNRLDIAYGKGTFFFKSGDHAEFQNGYLFQRNTPDINLNKLKFESVNEATEPEIISQLKDIVKNKQYQSVKDPKSGKSVKVDMQTANAVLQIYNGLSNVNKDNMVKMGLPKMIEVSYKIISKYR